MVSEDIVRRRDEFLRVMHDHGTKAPDEIVESVRETQEKLHAIFSAVPDARASRKPAPDEWCLRELALHAAFTERLIAQIIHHGARGSVPPAEYLVGAGIGMMPEDDGRPYSAVVSELEQRNADLLATVRDLPETPDTQFLMPHPFFGPLNCLEWAGFQRVHDIDHIQHAEKILAATP